MKVDEPEADGDGYLTDEYLECVRSYEFDMLKSERYMVKVFPDACALMPVCSATISDAKSVLGKPVKTVEFHTGGWSGAEEFLDILLGKFWVAHLHTRWDRGGRYVFEIPVRP